MPCSSRHQPFMPRLPMIDGSLKPVSTTMGASPPVMRKPSVGTCWAWPGSSASTRKLVSSSMSPRSRTFTSRPIRSSFGDGNCSLALPQRRPRLLLEDVDDLIAALAGGPGEDHRELRRLVSARERAGDAVLLDVDRLAGAELALVLLEPLLDPPLAHPDDLLLVGVAMEGMAGARGERHVHDAQR